VDSECTHLLKLGIVLSSTSLTAPSQNWKDIFSRPLPGLPDWDKPGLEELPDWRT
jgi:hypothetical protein